MSLRDRLSAMLRPIRLGRSHPPAGYIGWGLPNPPSVDLDLGRVAPVGPGHTTDRNDPRLGHGVDDEPIEQHDVYLVLSEEERAQGFVRPVRTSYIHLACGSVTRMSLPIAETYARDPGFYGSTFCCACSRHLPVGAAGEFIWDDGSGAKVGT